MTTIESSSSKHTPARFVHPQHFTIPMYRAGEKPHLKCWCGTTTPMHSGHIATFVHEHEQCKPKAEDETDGT